MAQSLYLIMIFGELQRSLSFSSCHACMAIGSESTKRKPLALSLTKIPAVC